MTPKRKPARLCEMQATPHPRKPKEPYTFLAVWSPRWGFLTPEAGGVGKPEMFDKDEMDDAECAAETSNRMQDGYLTDWRVVRVMLTLVPENPRLTRTRRSK